MIPKTHGYARMVMDHVPVIHWDYLDHVPGSVYVYGDYLDHLILHKTRTSSL